MSEMIKLTFPDGAVKEFAKGTSTDDVALSISPGLRKKAYAGKINGVLVDLKHQLKRMQQLQSLHKMMRQRLEILRHSTAHLTAQAIKRLFPDVKLGIGPVIEGGFYYDIDSPTPITAEDLPAIEKK